MSNRIEQVIGDIEEYIDGCKMQAFSNTKIIVDRPQLEEFLDELRHYTPEEVKKYQRMLNNRDKILTDAKKKANEVEEKAQAYAERMTSENQITRMAYEKANQIIQEANEQATAMINDATEQAEAIREGALNYTNELLDSLRSILSGTLDDTKANFANLVNTLDDHLNIVVANQNELNNMDAVEPEDSQKNNGYSQPFFETDYQYEDDGDEEDDDLD